MYKSDLRKLFWIAFIGTIIMLMFLGCASQKRCFKLHPPEIRSDSTITVDTLYMPGPEIEVRIVGDTVFKEILLEIPCPELEKVGVLTPVPVFSPDTMIAETKYAKAGVWVEKVNDKYFVRLKLIQHDKILKHQVDSLVAEIRYYKTMHSVEVHKEPPEIKIPWLYRASLPVAIVLFLLLIFALSYRRK